MVRALKDSRWYLNDLVINDYMNLIVERDPVNIYSFDSYFFTKYKTGGHQGVRQWTKKVNIFTKSKVFIPINIKRGKLAHWVLICINMQQKRIHYYDSIFRSDKYKCASATFDYLKNEHLAKMHRPLDEGNWRLAPAASPFQRNGVDCGVFILTFAEYISRDASFNFYQHHMRSFRQLIGYELTIKKLVDMSDCKASNIEEFIQRTIAKK